MLYCKGFSRFFANNSAGLAWPSFEIMLLLTVFKLLAKVLLRFLWCFVKFYPDFLIIQLV